MEQTINLNTGNYTLTFMACGRPTVYDYYNYPTHRLNPIIIQLNGIQIYQVIFPTVSNWIKYTTTFNVTTSGNNTIKFLGEGSLSTNDLASAIQGISIINTSTNNNTITVSIKNTFVDNATTTDGLSFQYVASFYNTNVTNLKIIQFDNIPLSRGGSQFASVNNLTIQDTKSPNILSNTSMARMFQNATNFNSNISRWNTSNVTNMSSMFQNATAFNQKISYDASNNYWDTTNVTNMNSMFDSATVFNNGQAANGITQPMNWIISFTGTTATNFSTNSALTEENKPAQFKFIYSFDYTGSTPIADIIASNIPIIKTSNINYTYTIQCSNNIVNGNFSQPVKSNNTFEYITSTSTVPGWNFQNVALLNNSSAWGFPIPYPDGNQCAVVQNTNYMEQTINLNVGSYTLSFMACSRPAYLAKPANIKLNGTTFFSVTPPDVWTSYSTTFNITTNGNNTIKFQGTTTYDTAFSKINITNGNIITNITNGDFSEPDISNNPVQTITDSTTVSGWNFQNAVLVNKNTTSDNFDFKPYPAGVTQCAAIRGTNYIEQIISLNTGSYTLSLMMMVEKGSFGNPIDINLNGITFFSFTPSDKKWVRYTATLNITTSGNNTIRFIGTTTASLFKTGLTDINIKPNNTTVTITSTFTDNGTTNDGLSFQNVASFYNDNTSKLKIIQFGYIPLSRGGSQFASVNNLTIQDTKSPNIL